MTTLNEKEKLFLAGLISDDSEDRRDSFLNILFMSKFIHPEDGKEKALSLYEQTLNINFIKNSHFLFEMHDGNLIGKNGNFFFVTCAEGDFTSLGRNIQNIPYYLNFNDLSYMIDIGESIKNTNYARFLEEYVIFCHSFKLNYCSHLKQDFNSDILILDKEEMLFYNDLELNDSYT